MQDRKKGLDGKIITNKQCQKKKTKNKKRHLKDFWKVASITLQWNGCKLKRTEHALGTGDEWKH